MVPAFLCGSLLSKHQAFLLLVDQSDGPFFRVNLVNGVVLDLIANAHPEGLLLLVVAQVRLSLATDRKGPENVKTLIDRLEIAGMIRGCAVNRPLIGLPRRLIWRPRFGN
jgi:hypothetical protein